MNPVQVPNQSMKSTQHFVVTFSTMQCFVSKCWVAHFILVRLPKDKDFSHGEMEGLAPDRAGHSG
jgi:hypothetical protein